MKNLLMLLLAALFMLTSNVSLAQNAAIGACADKDQAKREFVKGRLAYRRGNYSEAIILWQNSYAACEKPLTLFNIGNAYERLGDLKAALTHFERYLPYATDNERTDLNGRIAALRRRVADQEKIETDRAAQAEAARRAAEEEQKRTGQPTWPTRSTRRPRRFVPILGWTLVGVGGAAVIAGVVMDLLAANKRPNEAQACSSAGGRLLCRESERDDIEQSNTLALAGDIAWIAGSVVAAGGATILILGATRVLSVRVGGDERRADKPDTLIHDARIAPYGLGLQLVGSF